MFLKDKLNISSTKREYTDEGFLIAPAKIARSGIQEYYAFEMGVTDKEPTDIIRVYRPEEEVFSDESLKSFANKPVTNNHPPELVNKDNYTKYSIGHAGPEVIRDGMFATTILHIMDSDAVKRIEDGTSELSNGYTSDIEWGKGISPDGDQYDAIQRNIKGNHIALVDRGRCGSACKVSDNLPINTIEETNMAKITIDGVGFEVPEQAVQAVRKLQNRLDDAEKELDEKEAELEKKKKDEEVMEKDYAKSLDTLQAKVDDAQAKAPTAKMLDAIADKRITTRDAAVAIIPDYKWQGKDCATIKKEVVIEKNPTLDIATVSPDYIRARFDMLAESVSNGGQQNLDAEFTKQVNKKVKSEDNLSESDKARNKFMKDSQGAWKKKVQS